MVHILKDYQLLPVKNLKDPVKFIKQAAFLLVSVPEMFYQVIIP